MRPHIIGIVNDDAAHAVAGLVEIAGEFGLSVNDDGIAAGQSMKIDMVQPAIVGDIEAVVNLAFTIHAIPALRLTHQPGETVLQNARPDPAKDVFAALPLQNDAIYAIEMQKLGQ